MESTELIRNIDKDPVAPVYLFTGDAELLMEEAWRRLVERLVPPAARRFNGERLSAKDNTAAQVVARLRNLPMFGTKQLLMVQNIADWPKDQKAILLDYLEHPFPTGCLVLTSTQKKGLEKITPAVESKGIVAHFTSPTEREAPRWLQERARGLGKSISPQAASLLVGQVGLDLYRLERELEKLVTYAGERGKIELEDVKQLVSSQRSFTVFELLRYVSQQEAKKAVTSLRSLILGGESPLSILALLARQVRLLWQVQDARERGMAMPQITQRLNLPSFVVKGYAQQAGYFTGTDLYRFHEALCVMDVKIKSTGTAPEILLEELILALCRHKQKTPGASSTPPGASR